MYKTRFPCRTPQQTFDVDMLRDIDSVLEIEYKPKSVIDLACNSRTLRLYKHGTTAVMIRQQKRLAIFFHKSDFKTCERLETY
jgi:hypothetical protein